MQLTWRTMSMVTSPADGMAAAPMAARVAVNAITQMLPIPRPTPCACRFRKVSLQSYVLLERHA